jgi:hypothetical protein
MAFLKSRRKTKIKLKEAEEQVETLNNKVKSLQQSNSQLQKDFAISRDKIDELTAKLSISEKSAVCNDGGEDSSIIVEVEEEKSQDHENNTDTTQGEVEKLTVSFAAADESDEEKLLQLLPESPCENSNQEPDTPQTNEELQAKVIHLTQEVDKLATLLAKEKGKSKRRRDEAKERRERFKDKLSNMNERLKEDFGDEQVDDDEESMGEKENKEQQKC